MHATVLYKHISGYCHIRIIQTLAGTSLFQTVNAIAARKVVEYE
jgi:hypothetical protein